MRAKTPITLGRGAAPPISPAEQRIRYARVQNDTESSPSAKTLSRKFKYHTSFLWREFVLLINNVLQSLSLTKYSVY